MAKMIDKEPKYEGEKKVWHDFYKNLPSDWVIYNTRSINGREYDFCVISPNMGLFVVEVKGWNPDGILNVIDANTIFWPERRIRKIVRVDKSEAIGLICERKFSVSLE